MLSRIISPARRWGGLLTVAMVGLLALVAACGGGDETPTSAAPTATSAAPTATSAPGETRVPPTPTPTTPPRPAWEVEWEQALEAAREEGAVSIRVSGQRKRQEISHFLESYPDIELNAVSSGSRAIAARIDAERQAGLYLLDGFIGGPTTPLEILRPKGQLASLRDALILPEVVGDEFWVGGLDSGWGDRDTLKYTFFYTEDSLVTGNMFVNHDVVPESEFSTLDDLFKPEFRGRWSMGLPLQEGIQSNFVNMIMVFKGPEYLKRLLTEDGGGVFMDERLRVENVIRGTIPITMIGPNAMREWKAQGLGLNVLIVDVFEGLETLPEFTVIPHCCGTGVNNPGFESIVGQGGGAFAAVDSPPNPNGFKVFANWLLGVEGQTAMIQPLFDACSRRVDLPQNCAVGGMEEGKAYVNLSNTDNLDLGVMVEEFILTFMSR